MEQYQRTLLAAQGYYELEMFDDVLVELTTLPDEVQHRPEVVQMRLVTCMRTNHWSEALDFGLKLCQLQPDEHLGFIHTAFCLHELGRTAEARQFLTGGPPSLLKESNYFYNLACYECVLGNVDEAKVLLARSFALDAKYREHAKTDPDLRALRAAEQKP